MKLIYSLSILLVFGLLTLDAQTTYDIEAGGGPNGPTPYYSPQFITIEVGDIVRWTNSGGTHNVDATLATFPANPEGFTNGDPSSVLWVFEHIFTMPGEYDFECAAFDHNETQFGTITVVEGSVGVEEYATLEMDIYPNPTSDFLNVYLEEKILEANILSIDLKRVQSIEVGVFEKELHIDLGSLSQGAYFLSVKTYSGKAIRKFLKE